MPEHEAEADDHVLTSALLTALGVVDEPAQRDELCRELEWFAHPRVQAATARATPVDTLVEFLATTRLALPAARSRALRTGLAEVVDSGRSAVTSPRDVVIRLVREVFGAPAGQLADKLTQLISRSGQSGCGLDSTTVRRLYAEASDLCDVWVLALSGGLVTSVDAQGTADELYATEAAVRAVFDPDDPAGLGRRRLDLVDLVRQLTELVALDRWGLLPERDWPSATAPALGWPAVLAQAQYRLRQISASGPPPRIEHGTGKDRTPSGDRRHGLALHLLAAFDASQNASRDGSHALAGPTPEQREAGRQRIQRSLHPAMPWATRLQVADLAWSLRRTPELMADYGLGDTDGAEQAAADLPALLSDLRPGWFAVGPDHLPLNSWELRELFPELCRLLAVRREQVSDADLGAYWDSNDPSILPELVAGAYLASCAAPGRFAAALSGELAAFGLLFAEDAATDAALALLGEQPRQAEPGTPWWDDLTWQAWLRGAAAEVMRQARPRSR
ncbi:hypothetical protein [Streptacidiphilus fuscans]|uniref:Uncharacterized protein n=1 Tax=Streptacidiphilus fuscans TaxID=2789292 RepID=A0A931B6U4_9ACTN|nr:hypothetical protein [Streptacidiphilus fuscans]MBF9069717.1 hypothetical protein [Streptacidiphilus fuscans]